MFIEHIISEIMLKIQHCHHMNI